MDTFFTSPAFRIILFVVFGLTALSGPVWLACVLGLLYALLYRGAEICLIALLVDAFYGYQTTYPYVYTVSSVLLLVSLIAVEKYITVYNSNIYVS